MAITDPEIIKKIVRKNFDNSVGLYEKFEHRFGLFGYLATKLANECNIRSGMRVCDIGCGTGTSSFELKKLVGENGLVLGLDLSEKMLVSAHEKLTQANEPNLRFIRCDADALTENIDIRVDSVLYNACIFLIPEPKITFNSAYKILTSTGTIGMDYLAGLYGGDSDAVMGSDGPGDELFTKAKQSGQPFAPYGRRITDGIILPKILKDIGFKNIREGMLSKAMTLDEMKAFYSIPAQSAALFPKNTYEERLTLFDSFIEYFQKKNISTFSQHWGWCVGEK